MYIYLVEWTLVHPHLDFCLHLTFIFGVCFNLSTILLRRVSKMNRLGFTNLLLRYFILIWSFWIPIFRKEEVLYIRLHFSSIIFKFIEVISQWPFCFSLSLPPPFPLPPSLSLVHRFYDHVYVSWLILSSRRRWKKLDEVT